MRRMDRYILGQIFWWTVFVSACLICVVWLTQSLQFVEMIVNRGLSIPMFVYFTALMLPTFVSMILPIALLFAVLFTYNKLTIDSELVVMRAAGISQWSLARPALILGIAATLVGYFLSLYLVPMSFRTFKDLQFRLRNAVSTVVLQEGVFNPVMKGVTVYVRARTESGELLGIIVHDGRNPDLPMTMMAQRGAIIAGERGKKQFPLEIEPSGERCLQRCPNRLLYQAEGNWTPAGHALCQVSGLGHVLAIVDQELDESDA